MSHMIIMWCNIHTMCMQAHNQAKSSATSALQKAQAAKDRKEQEVADLHHSLEEANHKLQASLCQDAYMQHHYIG